MQAVFFPEDLHDRAPDAIGHFCAIPGNEWLTLVDLVEAMQRGETVTVRPASGSEIKRAEALIAMFEIGAMLAEKMGTLLDQEQPDVAAAKIDAFFSEAVHSTDTSFPGLLDIETAPVSSTPGPTSYAGASAYRAAGYAYGQG